MEKGKRRGIEQHAKETKSNEETVLLLLLLLHLSLSPSTSEKAAFSCRHPTKPSLPARERISRGSIGLGREGSRG